MSLLQQSTSAAASPAAERERERRHRRAHTSTPHTHTHAHARKHTRSSSDTTSVDALAAPPAWQQTAQAYTWVIEDESHSKRKRSPFKTEEWVREQRFLVNHNYEEEEEYYYHSTRARARPLGGPVGTGSKHGHGYGREDTEWEELVYVFGAEAEDWMRQQERARRLAQEREKARARIQEEVRRIEARFQQKREAERRTREEERRRASDKEKRDRAKLDRLIVDAWGRYETGWTALSTAEELEFRGTPWPLIVAPRDTGDITRDGMVAFLFAAVHSQGQTRRERIRRAQLRWHPDRFRRILGRVAEKDRASVEEGAGIVARCLNELMEKEQRQK